MESYGEAAVKADCRRDRRDARPGRPALAHGTWRWLLNLRACHYLATALMLTLLSCVSVASCTLAVDLEPLQDGVCPSGQKACERRCVPINDVRWGCAPDRCAPCALPQATSYCADGVCMISVCDVDGYEDCDASKAGCETDTNHDLKNCGACARACTCDHGTPVCTGGRCKCGRCDAGLADCDKNAGNGCESDASKCLPP